LAIRKPISLDPSALGASSFGPVIAPPSEHPLARGIYALQADFARFDAAQAIARHSFSTTGAAPT
jgi:hypothetical protein